MNKSGSAELSLLLRCCSYITDSTVPVFGQSADFQPTDWIRFLFLTKKHRLFPQAYQTLKNFPEIVPQYVIHELEAAFTRHRNRMTTLSAVLLQIHLIFEQQAIYWIALKGPVMAEQLYGDPAHRQTRDLDILVRADQIDQAIGLLLRYGFHLTDTYFLRNPEKRILYMIRENHVRFRHPEKRMYIELHWSVSKYFTSITAQYLFEHAVDIDFQGKTIKTLSPELCFPVLASHGVYHRYEELFWLYDIVQLMQRPGFSQSEMTTLGRELRCTTAVRVSMALAGEIFNGSKVKQKSTIALTRRERFIVGQCRKVITEEKSGRSGSFLARLTRALRRRISDQIFLLLMTDTRESRWRVLSIAAIKPYVWPDEARLPVNNWVYLIMTQFRWIRMLISGTMKPGGRIRKQQNMNNH